MLLARMAETVYWAGRYLERAEATSRVVDVHGDTHMDLPIGADVGWEPLVDIFAPDHARGGYESGVGDGDHPWGTPAPDFSEERVVRLVLSDLGNPSSVLASLDMARRNLRDARPVVPREAWEIIHSLWNEAVGDVVTVADRDHRVQWLRRVVGECQRITGVLWGSMRRDEAMSFLVMGQQMERADITARVLLARAGDVVGTSVSDSYRGAHQMAVLRSLAAYQPFRRSTWQPETTSLLRYLLQDERLPRSVALSLAELRGHAKELPQNESVLEACGEAAVTVAGADRVDEDLGRVHDLLSALIARLSRLHDQIVASYFSPAPVAHTLDRHGAAGERVEQASTGRPGAAAKITSVPAERRYRVTHITSYEYDGPVDHSYNEAHLCPRESEFQRRLSYVLGVDPIPTSQAQYRDPFGNTVNTFGVTGGFTTLTVTASSEVTVSARHEPPDGMPWDSVRSLLDADRRSVGRDARRHRAASRLVPTSEAFADYASESFLPRRPLVDAARHLSSRIHRDFVYEPGFTSVTTPLNEVFEHKRGVCQDFAHFMIACVRSLGLAARYVSGYMETLPPGGSESVVGGEASHAWASVYCPGWGWVDIDPTNDRLVGDGYVVTAWGRDYWDVSPLRGSVEGGGNSHRLHVAVTVQPLAAPVESAEVAGSVAEECV